MILYIHGEDTYRSQAYLSSLVDKFVRERDPSGMNLVRLDMEDKKTEERLFEEIFASPFLSEKRMVVVKRLLTAGSKEFHERVLVEFENGIPDSTILIVWDTGTGLRAKSSKALQTFLEGQKYSKVFPKLDAGGVRDYVHSELHRLDLKLDREALSYLISSVSPDTWVVAKQLEQLSDYAGGDTLSTIDVEKFITPVYSDNIFELVDAIMSGHAKKVFWGVRRQYEMGKDALYIVAMLVRQFRILLEIRDVEERGGNTSFDLLAKQLKLHPFVVKKSVAMIKPFSMESLSRLYRALLELDSDIKLGRTDAKIGLDIFLGKICVFLQR